MHKLLEIWWILPVGIVVVTLYALAIYYGIKAAIAALTKVLHLLVAVYAFRNHPLRPVSTLIFYVSLVVVPAVCAVLVNKYAPDDDNTLYSIVGIALFVGAIWRLACIDENMNKILRQCFDTTDPATLNIHPLAHPILMRVYEETREQSAPIQAKEERATASTALVISGDTDP